MKRRLVFICLLLFSCSEVPRRVDLKSKSEGAKSTASKTTQGETGDSSTKKPAPSENADGSGGKVGGANGSGNNKAGDPSGTSGQPMLEISPTTGIAKVPAVASPGCNKDPDQALGKYVQKKVAGMDRSYQLFLPTNYDKTKPYRLMMLGHGCGGSDSPFKMDAVSKDQAIIVALKSSGSCFIYEMKVEGPYFDEVLKQVSNESCVDTNRVFVAGFSSGSWLTNMLGCARSNVIRAQGNASGALPGGLPNCQGPIPAFMVHDEKDKENTIEGGEKARDRILKINSCSNETEPYDYDDDPKTESPCVKYKGCKAGFPVVWCKTSGNGHTPNEPISTKGFWKFWSGF